MIKVSNFDLETLLTNNDNSVLKELINTANHIRTQHVGNKVYLRGLIEFTNYCSCDCYYCGIRKSNLNINRYYLAKNEIVSLAKEAYLKGYQSICLQSGELKSDKQINYLADIIKEIKDITQKDSLSLGITLSTGEMSYKQYKRLWDAGAHRYLLRIETSDRELFKSLHPPNQTLENRIECLYSLKEIGFQVGTGVMIGVPGQTYEHLIQDLLFFKKIDIDMLGLGPYIPHPETPMGINQTHQKNVLNPYINTIKMIAISRILFPKINIVASTALQSINKNGLKEGLRAGANIVMPILTPSNVREDYMLYANKAYTSAKELINRIKLMGYEIGLWEWGDSPYYFERTHAK